MIRHFQTPKIIGQFAGKITHFAADAFLYRPALPRQPLGHKHEKTAIIAGVSDKNTDRFVDQFVRLQYVRPRLTHHASKHQPQFVHQLQSQVIHVAKMPVKRRRHHACLPGDFPDAQAGKVPPLPYQGQGRAH